MEKIYVYRNRKKTFKYNAKEAPLGTVRTWSDGEQHKKTSEGWVDIKRGKTKEKDKAIEDKHILEKRDTGHAWGTESGYEGRIGDVRYTLTYDTASARELTLHSPSIKSKTFTEEDIKSGKAKEYIEKEYSLNEDTKRIANDYKEKENFKINFFTNRDGKVWTEFSSPKNVNFTVSDRNIYVKDDEDEIWEIKRNMENPKKEIKEFVDKYKNLNMKELREKKEKGKEEKQKIRQDTLKEVTGKSTGWNGNVYGKEKYGYKIYVDNEEYKITPEQAKKLM